MRVHIVKSEDTWILRRIAHSIRIPGCTVGMERDLSANCNLYINYMGLKEPGYRQTKHVAWFTHLPNMVDGAQRRQNFRDRAKWADHCIAMCQHTAAELPSEKTSVWGGTVHPEFLKPSIVLGVAAKISRRKCPERIEALKAIQGVEVRVTGGDLSMHELVEWYKGIDYLVVTSDTEGGPYSVLEAIAAGKPIIAPDVGWCWEYPTIHYNGTTEGLVAIVKRLRFPPDPWGTSSVELEAILRKVVYGG